MQGLLSAHLQAHDRASKLPAATSAEAIINLHLVEMIGPGRIALRSLYIYIYIYIYLHELELAPVYMERLSRPAMTSPDHRVRVIHLTGLSSLAAALSSIGYISFIYRSLYTQVPC